MGPHIRNKTIVEPEKTVLKLAFENINKRSPSKQKFQKLVLKDEQEMLMIDTKSAT